MTHKAAFTQLGPHDILENRPFTHPENNDQDLSNLAYMLNELRHFVQNPHLLANDYSIQLNLLELDERLSRDGVVDANGRSYRIAFCRVEELLANKDLIVIGFCGQKRPVTDRLLVETIDEELIAESPQHPYFLSYSSLELAHGDWCNLVLFSDITGPTQWNLSARHWQAVREIAPQYYQSVRLHNGCIPGGLTSGNPLTLWRTKYYDFLSETAWQGIREFPMG